MPKHTIFITSPLEAEHVARIRAVDARLEVLHAPDLLPPPRYVGDHKGGPIGREAGQLGRWRGMLGQADICWDLPAAEDLAFATRLRWVQTTSTGVGQAVARLGLGEVLVTTARGVHAGPLAEFAFMALLAHFRDFSTLREEQLAHRWVRSCAHEVAGRVLVTIGAGDLARGCARLGQALGMRVVAVARDAGRARAHNDLFDTILPVGELHAALAQADAVVVTVPHTPSTENLIDRAAFAAMRPGVAFVNIARGQVVDEAALIDALGRGDVGFAALDVALVEPLPADSPLWDLPNVLISPHSASTVTTENRKIVDIFVHNLRCWLDGRLGEMKNVLNKQLMYLNWEKPAMQPARRLLLAAALALLPLGARAAQPSGEVILNGYGGAFQDNYMKAVVLPFMAQYPAVKVIYAVGGNSAQMLGQLRAQKASPQVDVSIIDFSISRIGNVEGIYAALNTTDVPNLADVIPQARMGKTAGGEWGPGLDFDNLVMIYGAGVHPAPSGIADLLNPANKGKIVFSAVPNVVGTAVQILTAKYLGLDYKGPLDPVIATLKKIGANVQTWQATPDNYTMIINGQAAIGIGWNARAQYYIDKSHGKLKSVVMREGGVLDIDTINLVAGAPNPVAAKAFINYALSPAPQVRMAEAMYYGPTNAKAVLPPALLARTSTAPATLAKMVPVDWNYVASVLDQWSARWRREVIPAQ